MPSLLLLVIVLAFLALLGVAGFFFMRARALRLEASADFCRVSWRSLVRELPAFVFVLDRDGRIRYINRPFPGHEVVHLAGVTMPSLLDIEEQDKLKDVLQRVFNGKESVRYDSRMRMLSGEFLWYENRVGPVEQNGQIVSAMFIAVDVTEMRVKEDRLRKLSMAVESSPVAVALTDHRGQIEYVNAVFTEMSGYRFDELFGKVLRIFRSGEIPDAMRESLLAAIAAGKHWHGECEEKRKDGVLFWENISVAPVKDASGKVTNLIVLKDDITMRKRAEAELRDNQEALMLALEDVKKFNSELEKAQDQLVRSEKLAAIGFLAAGIAHEINNPLGYIQANMTALQEYINALLEVVSGAKALEDAVALGESEQIDKALLALREMKGRLNIDYVLGDVQNLFKETQEGEERIKTIIQDLRRFSRTDSTERMPANINDVLDGVINIAWNEIKYKAELVKEYGDALPMVNCNVQQLGQVFVNMLVNAAQAMETQGKIMLRTYEKDGNVCVDVADTGKGISPENMDKIFDPFFTTKLPGQGTGLGLSISYDIVKKHGGTIHVQSEEGKGTTFTVDVPVHQVKEDS